MSRTLKTVYSWAFEARGGGAGGGAGSLAFPFDATENPLGAPWIGGETAGLDWQNMQSSGGVAHGVGASPIETGYDDNIAALTGYAANQYIEGVIHKAGGYAPAVAHEIELHLRCTIAANSITTYEFLMNSGGAFQIVRWDGAIGNFYTGISGTNQNGGLVGVVNGDVMRFEVTGSNFSVKQNGVLKLTFTDATYSSGSPGVGAFWRPDASIVPGSFGFSHVTVGNL
jgi:hypothetical protein